MNSNCLTLNLVTIFDIRHPIKASEEPSPSSKNTTPNFMLTLQEIKGIPKKYATYSTGGEFLVGLLDIWWVSMEEMEIGLAADD